MAYETESWPYIPAKWHGGKRTGPVRVIVIHDMEAPENGMTAENVAKWFAKGEVKSSPHINVDNNSIVQSVYDSYVAYAAPGANHDGIQIELAGYASQGTLQWLDEYGWMLLNRAADAVAQYCLKYGIPPVKLTNQELARGEKGIVGHDQVSAVYHKSDHTDPGKNFPWEYFMTAVRTFHKARRENS